MSEALTFGSVCSGIEAASVAFEPLGWSAAWLAEIEAFPAAVLAHHYPAVPNLGDMTKIARRILTGEVDAPDILCGGTPCQAFSVAGLRESLADARGNLTLKFVELADAIDHVRVRASLPACIVKWENVPGVLSTKDNAFGCFLGGLAGEDEPLVPPGKRWEDAGCVYGPQRAIAWRTLDAQYFGLAQRRRRVFVVASARDDFDPAQVLFEWDGLRRDLAPSREAQQDTAGTLAGGARKRGGYSADDIPLAGTLTSNYKGDNPGQESRLIAGTLLSNGKAAGSATQQDAESGLLIPMTAACLMTGTGQRRDAETETILPVAFAPQVAATMVARSSRGGGQTNSPGHNADEELVVTHSLRGEGFDASEDETGRGTPIIPIDMRQASRGDKMTNNRAPGSSGGAPGTGIGQPGDPAPTLSGSHVAAIAFDCKASGQNDFGIGEIAGTQRAMGHANSHTNGGGHQAAMVGHQVRRLTPRECERLQGFPDDYTQIAWRKKPAEECPDGPRYKALGNSWAVPVVRWIGSRIAAHLAASSTQTRAAA